MTLVDEADVTLQAADVLLTKNTGLCPFCKQETVLTEKQIALNYACGVLMQANIQQSCQYHLVAKETQTLKFDRCKYCALSA